MTFQVKYCLCRIITYTDAYGRAFSSVCANHHQRLFGGNWSVCVCVTPATSMRATTNPTRIRWRCHINATMAWHTTQQQCGGRYENFFQNHVDMCNVRMLLLCIASICVCTGRQPLSLCVHIPSPLCLKPRFLSFRARWKTKCNLY